MFGIILGDLIQLGEAITFRHIHPNEALKLKKVCAKFSGLCVVCKALCHHVPIICNHLPSCVTITLAVNGVPIMTGTLRTFQN